MQKDFEDKVVTRIIVKASQGLTKSKLNDDLQSIKKIENLNISNDSDTGNWIVDITTKKGEDLREDILKKVVSGGLELLELKQKETSLEDIFRKLTNV